MVRGSNAFRVGCGKSHVSSHCPGQELAMGTTRREDSIRGHSGQIPLIFVTHRNQGSGRYKRL